MRKVLGLVLAMGLLFVAVAPAQAVTKKQLRERVREARCELRWTEKEVDLYSHAYTQVWQASLLLPASALADAISDVAVEFHAERNKLGHWPAGC